MPQDDDAIVNPADQKLPVGVKVIAFISLVFAVVTLFGVGFIVYRIVELAQSGWKVSDHITSSDQTVLLHIVAFLICALMAVQFIVFSVFLLRNKRTGAAKQAYAMLAFGFAGSIVALMLEGVGALFICSVIILIYLMFMSSYLDPSLAEERALQRRLQEFEDRSDAEAGVLGRDKTGKGYLELNFLNMFWIFFICCFLGWAFEMIVCPFLNGRIEDRTGMLIGPFSPIYGFGGLLMVIALNRFYNKNPLVVFLVSAFIGAAFEFLVSYFFQYAFGIVSWDYSNEPFNLDGRTDLFHAVIWGCLGFIIVRWAMPFLLHLINKIPWNWRYGLTTLVAAFMIINGACTLYAFTCWHDRVAGKTPDNPASQFFAEHFDNDFMKNRFPTMSIDPSRATHE